MSSTDKLSNTMNHLQKVLVRQTQAGTEHNTEEYAIFAEPGMAEKWRQDKSIVLADVVGSFKVFKDCNKKMVEPSDEELERVFGTKDRDAVVRRILETGEIQGELHTL
eukprot:TRINITY_DN1291_c0_g1_i2.p1 TRINITY_DN1291_c0_g1~~TRINITY_DN1291_c0_g1_i2.p1  ORF type:complete len:108 (+),score=21.21 TRINITY_DN1291_c0_g1_i2:227-550(+)